MRFEPQERDPDSPFDGTRPSRYSDLHYKAMLAREAGATALVVVAPAQGEDDPDRLPGIRRRGPLVGAGLPVLQIRRDVADAWLSSAGTSLAEVRAAIDTDLQPRSADLAGLSVSGHAAVVPKTEPVANVVGVVPGAGKLGSEIVVVGAHYDHLGYGEHGSMTPDRPEIHNGADDNASGVAAMLCGVDSFRRGLERGEDRRTVVVMAFTAEEIGLGGSGYYVRNPLFPLERTIAMVNLDMVGRVRNNAISALGTDSAPEWTDLVVRAGEDMGLSVTTGGDGYGPSDQMSFYEKGVPVVHLFSGAHARYHTPDDDAWTLNTEGGGQVSGMLSGILDDLAHRDEALTYTRASASPAMAGDGRGYGAWLGTVPDYTAMSATEGGVLLSAVRAGGPAERAGLRGGDRIVGMGGARVENLYDMTFVLRDHRPGETIDIRVRRDDQDLDLPATLGSRADRGNASAHAPSGRIDPLAWSPSAGRPVEHLRDPREVHLADLRQLTFGGENAEAYWSPDGRRLIFQRTPEEGGCDQQFEYDLDSGDVTLLSSGKGRTTCGYYAYPDGEWVLYATTEADDSACPAPPDMSQGYVWPIYDSFDIVRHRPGEEPKPFLPSPKYDAEATVCMRDGRVLFTSTRNGDLDLYVADADGSNLRQLTDTPGYDGGAFFTPDCESIIWRASRPEGDALADYRRLLAQNLVRPSALELFIMDADGGNVRQLTENGAANFAPYPLPDASEVLFSTNAGRAGPREFDIWKVSATGGEPTQVTYTSGFDGFPMFSPDGKWLVFASNRATAPGKSDTNLFVARWVQPE